MFFRGKAALKAAIAAETPLDASLLPYDEDVLSIIERARRNGRRIYIASASNERYVAAVAAHIGADGWFASDHAANLASEAKARRLVEAFGEGGFDYIGNAMADLRVWSSSRLGVAVRPSNSVRRHLPSLGTEVQIIERPQGQLDAWIKLVRVHQWAKNALVFVPMLTAHRLDAASFAASAMAFVAFSCAASAIYILNDLVDLEADRRHPTKRHRPLAAGAVPILASIPVAGAMMAIALTLAVATSLQLAVALVGYLLLTTAYTST